MKFITSITLLLLFIFIFAQINCANSIIFDLNKVKEIGFNQNAINTIKHNVPDCPVFPDKENEMEEHTEYEEYSENDIMFTKKTSQICSKATLVKKKSKNNSTKPSNESLGIIIPPPKA